MGACNMNPINHIAYRLRNVEVRQYPFPHFLAPLPFPQPFYDKLRAEVAKMEFTPDPKSRYHGRTFAKGDFPLVDFMLTKQFLQHVAAIFQPQMRQTFPNGRVEVFTDVRVVRDGKGYFIGPHTDARWKLISLLFYLPKEWDHCTHGTSIYVPNDPDFRCPGGPHHKFEGFERIYTAPFAPNHCFGFWKTDNSFHGVEPILDVPDDFQRDVLLYNVYHRGIYEMTHGDSKHDGQGGVHGEGQRASSGG